MGTKKNKKRIAMASSPSGIPTFDITQIYELPNDEYKTAEDVAFAYGFELLLNEKPLGEGGYAKVIKAKIIDSGTLVAVKIMDISGKNTKRLRMDAKNELFILEKTEHPHIVKVYTHFIVHYKEQQKNCVYIFMRMAESGSLSDYLRQAKYGFPEELVRKMFAQMVSAVAHMHSKGIAHRDLKLGNILLDRHLDVKVADFGLSRVSFRRKTGNIMSVEFKGTITYMAPEILRLKLEKETNEATEDTDRTLAYNTFYADVWALGVILFTMANRKYLFDIEKKPTQKINREDYISMFNQQKNFSTDKVTQWSRYWDKPSPQYEELIKRIFVFDAEKRIKISEICQHIWIRDEMYAINEKIKKNSAKKMKDI